MNHDATWLEQSLFLGSDLPCHPEPICSIRKLGGKFRRAKQAAILNSIKGAFRQEVQRPCLSKINSIVRKEFTIQIAKINPNSLCAQLKQNSAKPWLKLSCVALGCAPNSHLAEGCVNMK